MRFTFLFSFLKIIIFTFGLSAQSKVTVINNTPLYLEMQAGQNGSYQFAPDNWWGAQ